MVDSDIGFKEKEAIMINLQILKPKTIKVF